jgi:orotate phosphoribosyltransferase
MSEAELLQHLVDEGAVITHSHLVYTSGNHGSAYINMRQVAHQAKWLDRVADELAHRIALSEVIDLIIGPETLGRTLAGFVAARFDLPSIWCDIVGEGDDKRAVFSPKLNFGRLVEGKRVAIVDDLLTTGSSIKLVAQLIREHGGIPVIAAAVVRRTPDVTAEDCGVPELVVLADVSGFVIYTPEQCAQFGPCSRSVPMVLRPGHGHTWINHPENADYPVV